MAHTQRMQRVPPAEWPSETEPAEKLRIFIRTTLTRMLETHDLPWSTCLMMREMLQPTIACQSLVEDFVRPQLRQLLEILAELLPVDTPPHRRHQIAFSIIGQCLHYRVAGEFALGTAREIGAALRCAIHALKMDAEKIVLAGGVGENLAVPPSGGPDAFVQAVRDEFTEALEVCRSKIGLDAEFLGFAAPCWSP